jgi:SAM-dependent methyltransferase
VAPPDVHLDRARAETFGSAAADYDRYRPRYAEALFDDLAGLRPRRVLDVGCGTGPVAAALVARGLSVLGVEPDPRMADVARRRGVPVEVATFEAWDDAARPFDLVTCGASWHWIDPAVFVSKLARVVPSGGTVARFWNHEAPDEPVAAAIEAVYAELAPKATRYVMTPPAGWVDPMTAEFSVETMTYAWGRTLTAEDWVGMAATFSDHLRMEPVRLAALQHALRAAIDAHGGRVHTRGGTYVMWAKRP